MVQVVVLAFIWSAVGASVFFSARDVRLPQRLGLTLVTSLVFGAVGWVDVSSISRDVHSGPAATAKQLAGPAFRQSSVIR
jgi:hypothetical protein